MITLKDMIIALKITLLFFLLFITVQDFRSRAIYWWLPLLVFASSWALSAAYLAMHTVITYALVNLCIALLLLSVVALYILVKYKTLRAFTSRHFGLGDVLMLAALCPLMLPVNFILFLCLSHILMLTIELLKRFFFTSRETGIPYAGYMSLFLLCWTLLTFCLPDINFLNDCTVYFILSATP